ncbi:MAG TPA: sodium:calcium antiporter [Candidatus Vogelbacteria bacterium]|nr:sodium:calcium antiporter [Candidatus Vogelbacteria bacterium]
MFWLFNVSLFLISIGFIFWAGETIVKKLMYFSRLLGAKEFVVAFFVMASAGALPNLFVGVSSALRGIPELSFGDIMGNNLIVLTVAVGLTILFSPKKEIPTESRTVQSTSIFTIAAAILPIVLIADGVLSRSDALILIALFISYIFWLFSKRERFTKIYEEQDVDISDIKFVLRDFFITIFSFFVLIIAAQGVVHSASFFAEVLNLPIVLVGMLVVSLGGTLPETYFAVSSAIKGENWMTLANFMGAVIINTTLILAIIALIHPIQADGLEFSIINRIFLIASAVFFYIFTKTGGRIGKYEGIFLMSLYVLFLLSIYFI